MKNYAVITGASAGLGTEFAKQLAAKGYKLILTARREERLNNLAEELPVECVIIPADLSKTEECLRFFELVKDKKIDVFVNNAGFGDCNSFLESDLDKELDMIDVNVKAMHTLCKLFLQKMQKENHVVNVSMEHLPKSFVLAGKPAHSMREGRKAAREARRDTKVYISPLASSTLKKRAEKAEFED